MLKSKWLRAALCMLLILTMIAAPMSASAANKKLITILKTNVDGGRLREGPTSAFPVIRSLKLGEKVFYTGEKYASFCLVRTTKGEVGDIYDGFLSPYGTVRADQVYFAPARTNVYKDANSSRVGVLEANQHVLVFRISGNWALVKTLNGLSGFAKVETLTKLG